MPTTPLRGLPYPSADIAADVPLDMQKLAEKTETELTALDARHVRAVRRVMAAQNTFTATTWTDFPQSADAAALALSFVKNRADTLLVVNFMASAEASNPGGTYSPGRFGFGLRIGSTDYECARLLFNDVGAGSRRLVSGVIQVSGLAAGTYAIKPRIIRLNTGNAAVTAYPDDDFVAYSIEETP